MAGTRFDEAVRFYGARPMSPRQRLRRMASLRASDLFREPALQALLAAQREATLHAQTQRGPFPNSCDWAWTLRLARQRIAAARVAQHPAPRVALLNQAAYWRQTARKQMAAEAALRVAEGVA